MTWADVATDVVHVELTRALYKGVPSWDGLLATWQTLWPWHGRPWSLPRSGAATGAMERRTGRVGLVKVSPKVNRRRREYLNRARKAAGRRARERGRAAVGEHA